MTLKVAYLINQYPKVSHSFIRREIQALERQGVAVTRYALRGWAVALRLRYKAAQARFVVAVSSCGRGQLMRWLAPADWLKVQVVHCGLANKSFPEAAAVDVASRRFVCVGRFCEQKAQLLLIDVLAQLKAEGVAAELVLAGDGEMRADTEAAKLAAHFRFAVAL